MKKFLLSMLLLGGFLTGAAQDQLVLTFKEAVQIGLENNIPLKQERNTLTSRDAFKKSSYATLAPNINARGLAFKNDGNLFLEQTGEVINTVSQNVLGSVDADVLIYNGSSRMNAAKRDKKLFDAQLSTIARTEQDVISFVALQFLTVLQDQEQVTIAIQNKDNQQLLYDQISAMFENGSRAITDKYDQQYQLKAAELDVIRAENTLINDRAILAQTLMIDPNTDFVLEEPSWNVDDIQIEDYNIESLYASALANREDLKSIQLQSDAAGNTLSAFFGVSSRWSDATIDRDFEEQFRFDNLRKQYGFNLNIPIFNGMRNRANMIDAKIRSENAALGVENQEIIVKTDVIRAFQNFRDVAAAYQVSLVQFEAGKQSRDTQKESYELGISSLIELSRANNVFVEGQTSLSRSKFAFMFQRIMMDYAVGTLSFDEIPD
jgi:outer membrane protein